ncbi:MAG: DNA replication/repair protein RecF [Tindallia sp. MSAO_Bac2]|nr:MAG: DNA replication/repair protein RecF [Tindallia sp. MSAO_Bac2]
MILKKMTLKNYRNYEEVEVTFGPGLNIFIGENAQGKTNLLEALYLCASLRSFRTRKDRELIKKNEEQAYLRLMAANQDGEQKLELLLKQDQKKRIRKNGLGVTTIGDVMGTVKAVLFSPEDLKIVKDSPQERRQFIDSELIQISPLYYHSLKRYQKILKQRNQLLKNEKVAEEQLEVWDDQLSAYGARIIQLRNQFLSDLLDLARPIHEEITEKKEYMELQYRPGINLPEGWSEWELDQLVSHFRCEMEKSRKNDLYRRVTHQGPHRDDVHFTINDMEVRQFGSQGQKRTVVLSLKLAVLEWMKQESGEYPVLMMDDVTSELDQKRQEYLLKYLKPVQTFITTTHLDEKMKTSANDFIFWINDGKIYK